MGAPSASRGLPTGADCHGTPGLWAQRPSTAQRYQGPHSAPAPQSAWRTGWHRMHEIPACTPPAPPPPRQQQKITHPEALCPPRGLILALSLPCGGCTEQEATRQGISALHFVGTGRPPGTWPPPPHHLATCLRRPTLTAPAHLPGPGPPLGSTVSVLEGEAHLIIASFLSSGPTFQKDPFSPSPLLPHILPP